MIIQKEKRHSSVFWKAFQISRKYFSCHWHFNGPGNYQELRETGPRWHRRGCGLTAMLYHIFSDLQHPSEDLTTKTIVMRNRKFRKNFMPQKIVQNQLPSPHPLQKGGPSLPWKRNNNKIKSLGLFAFLAWVGSLWQKKILCSNVLNVCLKKLNLTCLITYKTEENEGD